MNEMWGKKENGKWKIEKNRVLRITRKRTVGSKVITIRHYIEV